MENQAETPTLESQDRVEQDRKERREKIQAARVREEQLRDLDSVFSIYNQIYTKIGQATTSLKETMNLVLILNQKLSSGGYREMSLVRRLKIQFMAQTVSAAINQLSKMNKMSKLISSTVKEEVIRRIESPPAFE